MSEAIASQRTRYPLVSFNYRVTVGDTEMGFSEVSGLAEEYETLSYRDGLSHWEGSAIVRYKKPSSEITLQKGVFAGRATKDLYEWMKSGEKRLLTLDLCDPEGNPVVTWTVRKAMVVNLEAPSFDASANEVAIETLTLWASGISVKNTEES